jgi:hypothetical protein
MNAALRDLLLWVDQTPRTYAEAIAAWQSTCPRFTTWEDALEGELIRVVRTRVELTPSGAAALDRARRPPSVLTAPG